MTGEITEHEAELLVRYCDGELGDAERTDFERRLAERTPLRQRLDQLRRSDLLIGAACGQILATPQPVVNSPEPARRPARQAWRLSLALAAGVAVAGLGTLIGWQLQLRATPSAQARDSGWAAAVLNRTLESQPSGETVDWNSGDDTSSGTLTVLRTLTNAGGEYCREYEFAGRRRDAASPRIEHGLACRGADGRWRIKMRLYPEGQPLDSGSALEI